MQGPPRRSAPRETLLSALIRRMAAIAIMVVVALALMWFLGYVSVPSEWFSTTTGGDASPTVEHADNGEHPVTRSARVSSDELLLFDGNSWYDTQFLLGASVSSGMPGFNPGDAGAAPDDYVRWFTQLYGSLGVSMVRVAGLMPVAFYRGLVRFNDDKTVPMYVLHGIEGPTEALYREGGGLGANAYNHTDAFLESVEDCVRAVQGDLPSRGYSYNVSRFVLGWVLGSAWDPADVAYTDALLAGAEPYAGTYVGAADGASPFESWLAAAADRAVALETEEYGWQRPLGVLNTPQLDPLTHASVADADDATVDPRHLNSSAELYLNDLFAAYQVVPFEPDFLRFEYDDYTSAGGVAVADPFAAYLDAIRSVHDQSAVFLVDTGVPASMACGYQGPAGRWQGNLTEYEQAAALYDIIDGAHRAGFQAVALREATDQWSAGTWNSRAQTVPFDRRAFWHNAASPNQGFGLLAVEPQSALVLDGRTEDWDALPAADQVSQTSNGVAATLAHDLDYLHLRLEKADAGAPWQFGVNDEELWVAFDTSPTMGATQADVITAQAITFGLKADALLHVAADGATLFLNKGIDYVTRYYEPVFAATAADAAGDDYSMPDEADLPKPADGEFGVWRMPVSFPVWRDDTGALVDGRYFDVGRLVEGRADTESPDTYDNRAAFIVSQQVLELRLPWFLLGYADPTQHTAWALEGAGYDTNVTTVGNDDEGVAVEVFLLGTGIDVAHVDFRDPPIFLGWEPEGSASSDTCFCERRKMGWELLYSKTSFFSIADDVSARRRLSGSGSGSAGDGSAADEDAGFDYCACGPDADPADDDELALVYQIFAWAVAALVIFYLYSKVLKDPLYAASDAQYARRRAFSFFPCLDKHPRLTRRLYFFAFYALVACFLYFTNFWVLRKLRDITGSVTGTAPCVYLAVVNTEALIILVATFSVDWPPEPRPYPMGYPAVYHSQIKRVALLITCHNSADRIEQTLQAALGTFEPHQIFVCDNGRRMGPLDTTREIVVSVSDKYAAQMKKQRPDTQYRPINYLWVPEGSKIVATFYALEHYVKEQHFDYVLTIDDDVLLTEHLWVPFDHFKDLRVQALAFTIRAENNRDPDGTIPPLNYVQRLQDMEYKLAGLIKLFQTKLGTCLFCHGAIGFWRREALHKVLERHDSMHMGDDLQEGLILHGLDDPLSLNGLRGGYIIKAVGDVSVGTQVPNCWYHQHDGIKLLGQLFTGLLGLRVGSAVGSWASSARKCKARDPHRIPTHRLRRMLHQRDLDPSGGRKKLITRLERAYRAEGGSARQCSVRKCQRAPVRLQDVCDVHGGYGCGEPSLFAQRVMGWDCTEQRFVLKFIEIALKGLVVCNKQTYFVISMMLGQLYLVMTDWLRVPIVLIFVLSDARWTFGAGLIIGWAFQVVTLVVFNETLLKRRNGHAPLGVKRKTIMYFPVYKMLMSVFVRSLATLYNALYYALIEQNKMKLSHRRVFKCSPPFTDDYRCQATTSKWSDGIFALVGKTREESIYQAPFYYYCANGHLPPGPNTVGSPDERRAYTEFLKDFTVCADFPDPKKQIDSMQEQISELFEMVAKLSGKQLEKPVVPPTPSFRRRGPAPAHDFSLPGNNPALNALRNGGVEDDTPVVATLGSAGGLNAGAPPSMYDQVAANEAQLLAMNEQLAGLDPDDPATAAVMANVQRLQAANNSAKSRVYGHITGPPNDLGAKVTGPPTDLHFKEDVVATQRIVGPPSSAQAAPPSLMHALTNTVMRRPRVLGPPSAARTSVSGPPSVVSSTSPMSVRSARSTTSSAAGRVRGPSSGPVSGGLRVVGPPTSGRV